jgi:hypothetical protein
LADLSPDFYHRLLQGDKRSKHPVSGETINNFQYENTTAETSLLDCTSRQFNKAYFLKEVKGEKSGLLYRPSK